VTIPLDNPVPPVHTARPLAFSDVPPALAAPPGRVTACPTCGKSLTIPSDLEGVPVTCPFCDFEFRSGGSAYPERPRRRRRRFRCPYCDSSELPIETRRVSSAGWTIFVIFLLFFLPLFWIGLLITEPETRCYDCRRRLD
jgi:DNA-directed RNA polymerase subunit RPC12/RpoP